MTEGGGEGWLLLQHLEQLWAEVMGAELWLSLQDADLAHFNAMSEKTL